MMVKIGVIFMSFSNPTCHFRDTADFTICTVCTLCNRTCYRQSFSKAKLFLSIPVCKTSAKSRYNPNQKCIFPFKKSGKEYSSCVNSKRGTWCATRVDTFGSYKSWGICSPGCPTEATAMQQLQNGKQYILIPGYCK